MDNYQGLDDQKRRALLIACAIALTAAFTASLPQSARAGNGNVTPPPVPATIQVQAGNIAFLEGHGVGTQNYICLPCAISTTCPSGFAFALFTPEATLFKDNDKQLTTHFFSPNPSEDGTIRATWQDSKDTSIVWGGQQSLHRPRLRRARCHCLASASGGWSPRGTDWWQNADGDHFHPAAEHLWRSRTVDRLCLIHRRWQEGVRTLHGRLLLL